MKRISALVAGIAVAAAVVVGGTAASAAPHAKANVAPAKVTQLQKLSRLDGQFIALTKRVKPCVGSAAQIKAAGAMRKAALKKARKSSVRVLRKKNVKMSKAVLRLAKFAGKCGASTSAPVVVTPGSGTTQPGSPPGSTTINLTTPMLLSSPLIDLSSILGGGVLPSVTHLVGLDELNDPLCAAAGAACVGIDVAHLGTSLQALVASVPLLGPLVTPLLNQVLAALGLNDLDFVFDVRRVSDTVVQIVPQGPLATVLGLLGPITGPVTGDVLGRLQLVPLV